MVKKPEKASCSEPTCGTICCFTLIKTDEFGDMVKGLLGPMMKGVMGSDVTK